jgi:serine/threonine-protein kinase
MIDRRFVLFKKVARGGMAEIYLGKLIGEDGFERVCCFKRILPHFALEKEFIEMFRDEAHIGKRLQHPNIVRVEGFEEVDGAYAIIMEFIKGADLRSLISACEAQKIKIPIPLAVHIIAESARGLHYAHVKKDEITNLPLGIVHRDISPQNLLLSFEGEVKVTDFGIAEAESKLTETKTGVVKGKFSYMSPEQIRAEQVDARTDVFALAIILWEIVTGRRLFHADNEILVIQMVRDCVIPEDIKIYNPDIDEELERIIAKGLKKDLAERYESAAAFEKDLRLYQNKHNPTVSSDNVGEFLREILAGRYAELGNSIKELLSNKEASKGQPALEIDLRQQTNTRPLPGTGMNRPTGTGIRSMEESRISKISDFGDTRNAPLPGQSGAHRVPRSPLEGTRRSQVGRPSAPSQQSTKRNVVVEKGKNSNMLLILLGVLIVSAGVYFGQDYFQRKNKVTWILKTVPDVVRIEIDNQPIGEGRYVKTPIVLKNFNSGQHSVIVSRPGFETEINSIHIKRGDDGSAESNIILKSVAKMAPLRISLKEAGSVQISLDNGLVNDKLNVDKPLNLSNITFGKDHVLTVESSNASSFTCQFTPRAQSWEAPFLVVIDLSLKKCTYPATNF